MIRRLSHLKAYNTAHESDVAAAVSFAALESVSAPASVNGFLVASVEAITFGNEEVALATVLAPVFGARGATDYQNSPLTSQRCLILASHQLHFCHRLIVKTN